MLGSESSQPPESDTRAEELSVHFRNTETTATTTITTAGSQGPGCDWETENQFVCRDKPLVITVSPSSIEHVGSSAFISACYWVMDHEGPAAAQSKKASKDIILYLVRVLSSSPQ